MKNQLIKLDHTRLNGEIVQTVNARDLWEYLGSKRQFGDWIKGRIGQYGFVEGQDYVVHKFVNNPAGGRPTLDYHLTINMGKELGMVENTPKGREVRRYFIACEREALAGPARRDDLIDQMLLRFDRMIGVVEKLIETLPVIVAAQKPKVRRPPIFEKDLPAIFALRQQGATLPDIARALGFGQTSLYYVIEGKYEIAPGGRVKRVADESDKVSAVVRGAV